MVQVDQELREELEHWRFLDSWEGFVPWRKQTHKQVSLATDASQSGYGVCVLDGLKENFIFRDYFAECDLRPIHEKEADAVCKAITTLASRLRDSRVDVFVDNMAVCLAWKAQGSKKPEFNQYFKRLFQLTLDLNIDLNLIYVPSENNPADEPSRRLDKSDASLAPQKWELVNSQLGPFTVDLMALDSNAQDCPRHFTPMLSPNSAGVNMFAQTLSEADSPYVFPPINIIGQVIAWVFEQPVHFCTIIVPDLQPCRTWWPVLLQRVVESFMLGRVGDRNVLLYPTSKGFKPDRFGLPWDLWVFKIRVVG